MNKNLNLSDDQRFEKFKNRKPLNLGSRQKRVLKILLNGHHIVVFKNLNEIKYEVCISDDEKDNTYQIKKGVFGSLCGNGLFEKNVTQKAVDPNVEVIEFRLIDSVKFWVLNQVKQIT